MIQLFTKQYDVANITYCKVAMPNSNYNRSVGLISVWVRDRNKPRDQ